jgi:hypothetical protein
MWFLGLVIGGVVSLEDVDDYEDDDVDDIDLLGGIL